MRKTILCLIIMVIFILPVSSLLAQTSSSSDLKSKQDKLTSLQRSLRSVNRLVQQLAVREKSLLSEINSIDKEVEKREADLTYLENRLSYLEGEASKTEAQIKAINQQITEMSNQIKKRLLYLDKLYRGGTLSLFLQGGHSLTDLNKYMSDFGFLMSYDRELLLKHKDEQKQMLEKKTELDKIVGETTTLRQDIIVRKETLEKLSTRKENILQQVQTEKDENSKKAQELQRQINIESREIQNLLKRIEAERKGKITGSRGGEIFIWPLTGRITSLFGVYRRFLGRHIGLDIAAPTGTPIQVSKSGEVVLTGWRAFYGLMVLVYHGNGVATRYAHLSRITVKQGQVVEQGQVIGLCGSTGYSTGPHLHFEIIIDGVYVDPMKYLP